MAFIGFQHSLFEGLSDFWQRFFADADQLEQLYRGTATLIGQAYLDLVANVLNVSLLDTPVFNREYFRLIAIREDETRYAPGATTAEDRWTYTLPAGLRSFQSLDNKVIEPTASLQDRIDYTIEDTQTRFLVDPTDPAHDGTPLPFYARRMVDVVFGGTIDDTERSSWPSPSWLAQGVRKGDILRLLDVGPPTDPDPSQKRVSDHLIVLVREAFLAVATGTSLTDTAAQAYVILRKPANNTVEFEALTFVGDTAPTIRQRLVANSVRVYAKRLSDGADVEEGIDYSVDYERGRIYRTSAWLPASLNLVNYEWLVEVFPVGAPPQFSRTGTTVATGVTARVTQIALWALDAMVDRQVLANNFGALINLYQDSSESYRALLRGIFQLYVLGPVLERIESAINVMLGLPVVRDDGEILAGVDVTSDPLLNYVFTTRPTTLQRITYEFPKETPIREDVLEAGNVGVLTFESFEPLTTAVTVTDYIQDPNWWHNIVIPRELFTADSGVTPSVIRRHVSPVYVPHVYNPTDGAKYGDPGLVYGADENGFIPATPTVYRHRLAFVLMDRYLKFHTFFVKFDPLVFSTQLGARYSRVINDLNELIFSAKPAHTYLYVQPVTAFDDVVETLEEGLYPPPDALEEIPGGPYTPVTLGVFLNLTLGSIGDPMTRDRILFTDASVIYGLNDWNYGDYFRYELVPLTMDFTLAGVPQAILGTPTAPRSRKIVFVYVEGTTLDGKRLVEGVDYLFDEGASTLTRATNWSVIAGVSVKILQLNIINLSDGIPNAALGDTPLLFSGHDPALKCADYTGAIDWFGVPIPVDDARDLSCVERALQISITNSGDVGPFSLVEPYRLLGFF